MAALGSCWAAAAGFDGLPGSPALLLAGRGAAGALAAVRALAVGMNFRACVAPGLGDGVLGVGVVVEVDKVVVVLEVVELGREALMEDVEGVVGEDAEAEETDVRNAGAG